MAMHFHESSLADATQAWMPVESLRVSTYEIPTDAPESDGTLEWDSSVLVLVEAGAAGQTGIGYTYTHPAAALLIEDTIAGLVEDHNALDVSSAWQLMNHELRNYGHAALGAMAISAVDCALWDLKARLLGLPLVKLLGQVHSGAPVYGSGGFTSYSDDRLRTQLSDWVQAGIPRVKMKVGRDPDADSHRLEVAREAIGPDAELFVDGNGAYDRKRALAAAELFGDRFGVTWFEEPVSSNDLEGLRLLRDRSPAPLEIAAGEYGWDRWNFKSLLEAGAVDVLQADVTRCGGITGLLQVAALCETFEVPLSAHCAPALSLHPCCAIRPFRHIEYFHDHVRIESMLFDGIHLPDAGVLRPDLSRAGNGLSFKSADAERFRL